MFMFSCLRHINDYPELILRALGERKTALKGGKSVKIRVKPQDLKDLVENGIEKLAKEAEVREMMPKMFGDINLMKGYEVRDNRDAILDFLHTKSSKELLSRKREIEAEIIDLMKKELDPKARAFYKEFDALPEDHPDKQAFHKEFDLSKKYNKSMANRARGFEGDEVLYPINTKIDWDNEV